MNTPPAARPILRDRLSPPKQERTREAWERIVDAGMQIMLTEGREALSIAAVCKRAKVAPTAIYARVDGIAGLFWAIFERGLTQLKATYVELIEQARQWPVNTHGRIEATVAAECQTFERNYNFLHPIIIYSLTDRDLSARGAESSRLFVDNIAALLPQNDPDAARDVARMLHQECVFRVMYGNQWLSMQPESADDFKERLTKMAKARLAPYILEP